MHVKWERRGWPAGGGVLFWQGGLRFSSRNSTAMILYSSSGPELFKTFVLFEAYLKKPLFLD